MLYWCGDVVAVLKGRECFIAEVDQNAVRFGIKFIMRWRGLEVAPAREAVFLARLTGHLCATRVSVLVGGAAPVEQASPAGFVFDLANSRKE
jgi:hypothetical protein